MYRLSWLFAKQLAKLGVPLAIKASSRHEMRDSSMTLNLSRYESGWY